MKSKARFLMRGDLNLSPGKLAVQVGHGVDFIHRDQAGAPQELSIWISSGRVKVVQKIEDGEALEALLALCRERGVAHHAIDDAGFTELPGPTRTGVVIYPRQDSELPRALKVVPLWREVPCA